jgi:hypothetical protein
MSNGTPTVPIDLTERVKEKLQLAFVELIPPEEWRDFVLCEWKRFTQETPGSYQSSPPNPSPLRQLARQFVEQQAKKILEPLVTQYFEQQNFTVTHSDVEYLGNGLVRSAIAGVIAGMLEQAQNIARQTLLMNPNGIYR